MTVIEVEYCVPCGLLAPAMETERYLLEEFGQTVDRLVLRPGHDGVFTVAVDGDIVWDKAVHGGDLDLNLFAEAVRSRVPAV